MQRRRRRCETKRICAQEDVITQRNVRDTLRLLRRLRFSKHSESVRRRAVPTKQRKESGNERLSRKFVQLRRQPNRFGNLFAKRRHVILGLLLLNVRRRRILQYLRNNIILFSHKMLVGGLKPHGCKHAHRIDAIFPLGRIGHPLLHKFLNRDCRHTRRR